MDCDLQRFISNACYVTAVFPYNVGNQFKFYQNEVKNITKIIFECFKSIEVRGVWVDYFIEQVDKTAKTIQLGSYYR